MRLLRIAALILLASAFSFGQINPTGNCVTDWSNIVSAISVANPGDVIQLGPGEFNLTCIGDLGSPIITTANLTIAGTPGSTILRGPGISDPNEDAAFFVFAGGDGARFMNLKITDFFSGIFVGQNRRGTLISDSQFDNVLNAIHISRMNEGTRITHNIINVPVPPSNDPTTDFSSGVAIFFGFRNNNILVADNTVTGPGASESFRRVQDLLSTDAVLRTAGIWQVDSQPPAGTFGRVSNNRVSGLDLGIQSSSNFGVVNNNTAAACALGLVISNDTGDGVTTVNNGVITGNDLRGNQVGLWMASATQNVISLNDARDNSLAGLLFLANVNGAASDGNNFILNQGSKQGVSGNQGHFVRSLRQ